MIIVFDVMLSPKHYKRIYFGNAISKTNKLQMLGLY